MVAISWGGTARHLEVSASDWAGGRFTGRSTSGRLLFVDFDRPIYQEGRRRQARSKDEGFQHPQVLPRPERHGLRRVGRDSRRPGSRRAAGALATVVPMAMATLGGQGPSSSTSMATAVAELGGRGPGFLGLPDK